MKIFVSVDMEGATGVVHPNQVNADAPDYAFGRAMQLHDALAVVRALRETGSDVCVNDSHDRMINLCVSEFPRDVEIISGSTKRGCMVEGIEGCDGAIFVAYHAKAGTRHATLDHTMSTRSIFDVKINGKSVGELGMNAAYAGSLGVPVIMVTGDTAVCIEAVDLLGPGIATVEVKRAVGRFAAVTVPPERTEPLLRDAAVHAVSGLLGGVRPTFKPQIPCVMEVTYMSTAQADAAEQLPGGYRVDGRTVSFSSDKYQTCMDWFQSACRSAGEYGPGF